MEVKLNQETANAILEWMEQWIGQVNNSNDYLCVLEGAVQKLNSLVVSEDEVQMDLVDKYPVKSKIAPLESTAGKRQADNEIAL